MPSSVWHLGAIEETAFQIGTSQVGSPQASGGQIGTPQIGFYERKGKVLLQQSLRTIVRCDRVAGERALTEEAEPKQVIVYADAGGKEPFTDWFNGPRDVMGRKRILIRLTRLGQGNYGDCEPVGEGVSELRMFFGPGYRVYFGEDADNLVILLCGGDKDSQEKDIERAKTYWQEYRADEEL